MKKLLALILALAMVLTLAACGGNADNPNSNTPDSTPSDSSTPNSETPPSTESNNPGTEQETIPENAFQLYDGSYLDLDGEYISGTPCKRLGGETLDTSKDVIAVAVPMLQEDGTVDEDFRLNLDVSGSSIFANVPTAIEADRLCHILSTNVYVSMDEYREYREVEPRKVYEPESIAGINSLESVGFSIRVVNDTGAPATAYECRPFLYIDSSFGASDIWIDGQYIETLNDVIAIYGEPVGVYAQSKTVATYIWQFAGAADAYIFVAANSDNAITEIECARECEAFRAYCEENNYVWHSVLEELDLCQ